MPELTDSQKRALAASGCEVRTDRLARCLYAVDASIYRVEPAAVAFPRSAAEAARVLAAAAENGVEITPRGAGTGLAGGALGTGLVVDFARHSRRITDLDLDRRTIRVGAGVVLDLLNRELAPHGLWFGPDVATSSRATIGGMIANNSSGAHAPVYGTTADHVAALEIVLVDGTVAVIGKDEGLPEIREAAGGIVAEHADEIAQRLPRGLIKRCTGYGLDRALRSPGNLTKLVAGSEGTLAGISCAWLSVVPRPRRRYLGILFFQSVMEALQSTVELADLGAAAIEHLDRAALDQTVGKRAFAAARAMLRLDEAPCEAILLVEFFDDDGGLDELARRDIGERHLLCREPAEQELAWELRRAGLSLLTSRAGAAKPWGFIEDVCVKAELLPDYVAGLQEILDSLGLEEASFYGHAASGELHVRPVLDLHTAKDLTKLRQVADQVSDLCRRFNGSLAAEHGVGMVRTEYVEAHLGPRLVEAHRRIKSLFDPSGLMNPGKIIDDGRFRVDRDLRLGEGSEIELPFAEAFAWIGRDEGFVANLEQCNGCGGCRKAPPTMCPTFAVTGDEALSTRGRANIIRAALEGRFDGSAPEEAVELDEVLSSCLSCKACVTECPSNVDMAHLKAELVHARHRRQGVRIIDRLIANVDLLGRLGTLAPGLANTLLGWRPLRAVAQRALGLDAEAPVPRFARQRFDRWFQGRENGVGNGRNRVILWDDTWVRYHEPSVGRAAVTVLEAAGLEVVLLEGRVCCGRPAASRGLLDDLRRAATRNLALLRRTSEPIVFLEPSCWSVFVDEYRQLGIEGADEVADRCILFEDLVAGLVENSALDWSRSQPAGEVAVHGHCHATALSDQKTALAILETLPGSSPRLLETGCCGMAGSFGMLSDHRELSHQVARPLLEAIEALPQGATVVASGTSCRHQIADLTDVRPLHLAEYLAIRLQSADGL